MRKAPAVTVSAIAVNLAGWLAGFSPAAPLFADEPAAPTPAAPQAQANFDITEFRVLGNHVLGAKDIERAVYPFLGPARSIDTVKAAAAALEKAYKDAGYATLYVDIPEQEVNDGIVRLKVTEGKLERVRVRGERYFSERQIRAELPALVPGSTPNLPALQQELTAINAQTPDRTVTPVLKAGSAPGTVEVDLDVKDQLPLHGSVEVDDRHTASSTPNRVTGALSYDNLWQREDSVAVQYQTAPAHPSDAEILLASYAAHVGSGGEEAIFSYTHSSSNVLAVGTLGVLGKGEIYGVHWLEPLPSTSTTVQSFNFGADYKDVLTSVQPEPTAGKSSAAVSAPVHYINWSALYSHGWFRDVQSYSINASVNFGARGLVNSDDEFENARYNAYSDYFYVRVGFNASQGLPAHLIVVERLSGQWSGMPLVNNEQFSLGGVDTVRGYLEAEALGDSGVAGSLELHSPSIGAHAGSILAPLYGFIFLDSGVTTIANPLGGQRSSVTLSSSGVGLRLDKSHGWLGYVDVAWPLREGVTTPKDQARVNFSLSYGF
jgi:hemolysin activation/secretion protein